MAKRSFQFLLSASTAGWQKITTARRGLSAFNRELSSSSSLMREAKGAVAGLVGAYAGMEAVRKTASILADAGNAVYQLESSVKSANREFENVGTLASWQETLASLGRELKIYSGTELKQAASRTVDMTKRLGLEQEQMRQVIARSADLAAGKTSLTDAIERVTAALRGEAEASEYLGLTLNETYVRSWYEARGAMKGAWKDLSDLEKAQIRYQILLAQSEGLAGKAAGSIRTIQGAWSFLTARLTDAIADNRDLQQSLQEIAATLGDNADEIAAYATAMVKGAAAAVKFAVDNRETILAVGELATKIFLLTTAAKLIIAPLRAMNAALVAMTGSNVVTFLKGIYEGVRIVGYAAASVLGPWGALAAAVVAAGAAIYKVIRLHAELKQIEAETAAIEARNVAMKEKLIDKLQKIGRETGVNIKTLADWKKAIESQTIVYDKAAGRWVNAHQTTAAAAESAAGAAREATGAALREMENQYRRYVQTIKSLQEEIARREMSAAERLREMSRSTMDDTSAWHDMKREAEEYGRAAEEAAAGGDWKKAKELGDRAAEAYARLNREVREGNRVTVSSRQAQRVAMSGYKKYADLSISALREMQKEAATAADELIKSAGFADLEKGLNSFEKEWFTGWKKMHTETALHLAKIEDEIRKIVSKTRIAYINVKVREARQFGGLIGTQWLAAGGRVRNLLAGGHLPGFGGGDRRHIMGEDGEYMLNKYSVRAAGVPAADAFNRGNWGRLMEILARRFGASVQSAAGGFKNVASLPLPRALAAAPGAADYSTSVVVNLTGGSGTDLFSRDSVRRITDAVSLELNRRSRRRAR